MIREFWELHKFVFAVVCTATVSLFVGWFTTPKNYADNQISDKQVAQKINPIYLVPSAAELTTDSVASDWVPSLPNEELGVNTTSSDDQLSPTIADNQVSPEAAPVPDAATNAPVTTSAAPQDDTQSTVISTPESTAPASVSVADQATKTVTSNQASSDMAVPTNAPVDSSVAETGTVDGETSEWTPSLPTDVTDESSVPDVQLAPTINHDAA